MALKRHQDEGGGGGDSWLNTYADMITLVLTFFVALLGMASFSEQALVGATDALKQEQTPSMVQSVGSPSSENASSGGAPNDADTEGPQDFSELREYIERYIKEHGLESQVEVGGVQEVIFIRFSQSVLFGGDSAALRTDSRPLLDFLGECFRSVEQEILLINVYGHTASVPNPETYPISARMLSSERAANVGIYFEDMDLDPRKINTLGQGNSFPVATNDTPEGREKNRRVDMAIVSTKAQMTSTQDLLDLLQGSLGATINDQAGAPDTLLPQAEGSPAD